jgi:hypothetical protein
MIANGFICCVISLVLIWFCEQTDKEASIFTATIVGIFFVGLVAIFIGLYLLMWRYLP